MQTRLKNVKFSLLAAAVGFILITGTETIFAQCGADGTQPCGGTSKAARSAKKSVPAKTRRKPKTTAPIDSAPPTVTKSKVLEPTATPSGGILNGKATYLGRPTYPTAARAVGASGAVNVRVTVDEEGNVAEAQAVSGHPTLRQAAEEAARTSKFAPTVVNGKTIRISGIVVYNFVP